MKKLLTTALSLFCFTLVFVSCSDDDNNNGVNGGRYENTPYSALSPEKQKEKLSEDALAFLTEMDGLNTSESLGVLKSFYSICEYYGAPELSNSPSAGKNIIYINDFYGKYTFNTTTEEWVKTTSADKLILSFPISEISNGEITVTGVASNVNDGEYQLPKELNAKLYVGAKQVGTVQVKANLTSLESIPSSANVKFILDEYELTTDVTKGGTNKASVKLSKGSKVLMNGNASLIANLDELVNDNANSIKDGNVEMEIMANLAAAGTIDFPNLAKEENAVDDEYQYGSKEYAEALAKVYNKYTNLDLVSRKDGTKIAKYVSIAVLEDQYTWDGITYTYYDVVDALQFNDNTIVEASVYFGSGFDRVENEVLNFINKIVPNIY